MLKGWQLTFDGTGSEPFFFLDIDNLSTCRS